MVLMVDSADHITGKTGLTLTITASKDGAAFASISPTVTERGNGWYEVALTTSHTDTLGDLALHITGTSADPSDPLFQVVAYLPGDVAFVDEIWSRATSNFEAAVKASPKCPGAMVIEATHKWKDDGTGNLKFADSADDYAGTNALARTIVATDAALNPLKEVGAPA